MTTSRVVEGWDDFSIEAVPKKHRKEFLKRRKAIEMRLIDRKRPVEIENVTGIESGQLSALVEKSTALMGNGRPCGYEALVPFIRESYQRRSPLNANQEDGRGYSGMFEQLMGDNPTELKVWVEDLWLKGRLMPNGKRQPVRRADIHGYFLQQCEALKISRDQYPFTSDSQGKRSLQRFLKEIEANHQAKILGQTLGAGAVTAFESDAMGAPTDEPAFGTCFQLDGHRIDAAASVEVPTVSGMPLLIPLFDIWTVELLERKGIVFGHTLSLTGNYNRYDVMRCIGSAMGLRRPHEGTQDFLPVHFIPEFEWMAINDIELDRALAHKSHEVMDVLLNTFNARVRFGKRRTPRKRPHIERLYLELESRGIARLPSSLKPGDGPAQRAKAMKLAMEHKITAADLEETIRRTYRDRLQDPRLKFEGRSQLDYLRWYMAQRIR